MYAISTLDRVRHCNGKTGTVVRVVSTESDDAIRTQVLIVFDDGAEALVHPYSIPFRVYPEEERTWRPLPKLVEPMNLIGLRLDVLLDLERDPERRRYVHSRSFVPVDAMVDTLVAEGFAEFKLYEPNVSRGRHLLTEQGRAQLRYWREWPRIVGTPINRRTA